MQLGCISKSLWWVKEDEYPKIPFMWYSPKDKIHCGGHQNYSQSSGLQCHSPTLVTQEKELLNMREEGCCLISFINLFILIRLPNLEHGLFQYDCQAFNPYQCSTCHPRKGLSCCLQGSGDCDTFSSTRRTLNPLKGDLPSSSSACCWVGVSGYTVLVSFSWKSNFPLATWNILP